MYSIYADAEETIVWLGEASDNSEIAMDTISKIGKDDGGGFIWVTDNHSGSDPSTAVIQEVRVGANDVPYHLTNEEESLIDE